MRAAARLIVLRPLNRINYEPNSLEPQPARESSFRQGGYVTYPERVSGAKVRRWPDSFGDHYSQATLFFQSMTGPEKKHIVDALRFELGKVTVKAVQERMLTHLANIDATLVREVAATLGLPAPSGEPNTGIGTSPSLSQERRSPRTAATRRVAILVADGVSVSDVADVLGALTKAGAEADVVAPHLGVVRVSGGPAVRATATYMTTESVLYDAVYVPSGAAAVAAILADGDAVHMVQEAFKHYKPIGADGDGAKVLTAALGDAAREAGVVSGASAADVADMFVNALAQHRFWDRPAQRQITAMD